MEKQSLKNEILGFSLASLHQEVYMSTQGVPVQLPSSQYCTNLEQRDKGLKDLLSSHKILWNRQLGTEREHVSVRLRMASK